MRVKRGRGASRMRTVKTRKDVKVRPQIVRGERKSQLQSTKTVFADSKGATSKDKA